MEALAVSDSFVYAGTELSSVWRYPFAAVTGAKTQPAPKPEKQGFVVLSVHSQAITIAYSLARADRIMIAAFGIAGRTSRTLLDAQQAAGRHMQTFDTGTLRPGCYVLSLRTNDIRETVRVLLP